MFSVYFSLAYQQSQNAAPAFTKTTVPVAFSVKQTQSQQPHQVNITSHGFVCVIWLMGAQGLCLHLWSLLVLGFNCVDTGSQGKKAMHYHFIILEQKMKMFPITVDIISKMYGCIIFTLPFVPQVPQYRQPMSHPQTPPRRDRDPINQDTSQQPPLSPKQMKQLSKLLSLMAEGQPGVQVPSTEQLFGVLKEMQHR